MRIICSGARFFTVRILGQTITDNVCDSCDSCEKKDKHYLEELMVKKYYIDINHLTEIDRIAIDVYIEENGGTVEEAVKAINDGVRELSDEEYAEAEAEGIESGKLTAEEEAEIDAICAEVEKEVEAEWAKKNDKYRRQGLDR